MIQATALLARRPHKKGMSAFGHVDLSEKARKELRDIVQRVVAQVSPLTRVKFHPDDAPESDEVLVAPLKGFDAWFQQKAQWSLERTVAALRSTTLPATIGAPEIRDGGWTFYAIRVPSSGSDAILVRAKSPSYGLKDVGKVVTRLVGGELVPIDEPLVAFDYAADLLVAGKSVFVLDPQKVERLFVDADAVKARAPATAASFDEKLAATLTAKTREAIERVCSQNANVARRVERLIRDGALSKVSAAEVRDALPDAGLLKDDFGKSGPIQASTDPHATILVDIAADLYYQPRFDSAPRRVAVYRKLK